MDNIKSFKERQREEAISRLKELTEVFDLNPMILENFKNGKVVCSIYDYEDDDYIRITDDIDYLSSCEFIKVFFEIEEEEDALVYHIMDTFMPSIGHTIITMLFVGSNEEKWKMEERLWNENKIGCLQFDYTYYSSGEENPYFSSQKRHDFSYTHLESNRGGLIDKEIRDIIDNFYS